MTNFHLTDDQLRTLHILILCHDQEDIRKRAYALCYVHNGYSIRTAARLAGIARNTLRYWLRRVQKEGVDILLPIPRKKSSSRKMAKSTTTRHPDKSRTPHGKWLSQQPQVKTGITARELHDSLCRLDYPHHHSQAAASISTDEIWDILDRVQRKYETEAAEMKTKPT